MLILGQKSSILGPTIFEIPQPNRHYRYTIYYGHFLLKVDFEIPNKSIKTSISYTLGSSIDEIQNIETAL